MSQLLPSNSCTKVRMDSENHGEKEAHALLVVLLCSLIVLQQANQAVVNGCRIQHLSEAGDILFDQIQTYSCCLHHVRKIFQNAKSCFCVNASESGNTFCIFKRFE